MALTAGAALKVYQAYNDYSDVKEQYEFFRDLAKESRQQAVKEMANERTVKAAKTANAMRTHTWFTTAMAVWIYAGNLFETMLLASPPRAAATEGSSFQVEIPRRSRPRAALRSVFFPGLGQKYYGNHGKGLFFQTSFIVLSYYALDAKMHYDLSTVEYQLAYDVYDRYKQSGSVRQIAAAQADAKNKFEIKDDRKRDMYTFAFSAGAIWLLNVVDAMVFGDVGDPPERFEFDTSYQSATFRTGLRVNF